MKQLKYLAVLPALLLGAAAPAGAAVVSVSNTTAIAIPDSGPANPYPSTISLLGLSGNITNLTVTLLGLTHTFPADLDVLLVGPSGASVLLMSDVGGEFDVNGINLTFADGGASLPIGTGPLVTGTFAPTNSGSVDLFSGAAPLGPYGTSLSVFNGLSPNGEWQLFVVDDASGDAGSFSGGWRLDITTDDGSRVPDSGSTLVLLGPVLAALGFMRRSRSAR